MYLIDTGKPEQATPELVEWTTSRKDSLEESFKVIGRCTERVIGGEDLEEIIKDHNKAQIKLGVVPKNVQELIESIETSGGYAKVIGAGGKTGGAGMVLVIIDNFEALSSIISNTSFTLFS